jgi:hypothetical protein
MARSHDGLTDNSRQLSIRSSVIGKAGAEHPQGPMLRGPTPLALLTRSGARGHPRPRARYARAGEGLRALPSRPIQIWAAGEFAATMPRNRSGRLRAGWPTGHSRANRF